MMTTLRALAEPHRFHIVELLRDGPRPVGDVVNHLGLRQPQVSKHLRVLSDAGLVDVRVDAQRRIYTLRAAPLQELEGFLALMRQAVAQAGSDPRILYHYAVALKNTGERDEAIKMLNAVVANKGQFSEKTDAQKLLDQLSKG